MRDQPSFVALARGRRCRRGILEVRTAVLGPAHEPPRVAFAVGRSVGGAVARNRVRRRLRAALHDQARRLEPGAGYLVRAMPGADDASYADLSSALREILAQLSPERP